MSTRLRALVKALTPDICHPALLKAYFRWRLWWKPTLLYLGNSVACPCCGGRFSRFQMVEGEGGAVNAQCPRCRCSERHRLLWLYLVNRTGILTDRAILLHVAPENIFRRNFSSLRHLHYVTADLESPVAMVRMDITSIPFATDAFDAILCSHVLEHVVDDRGAMKELRRVLRPGGWAILHVPIDRTRPRTFEDSTVVSPDDRARVFGQSDHVRIYGLDYQERLEAAGFEVVADDFLSGFDKSAIGRYGLPDREDIYICIKQRGAEEMSVA